MLEMCGAKIHVPAKFSVSSAEMLRVYLSNQCLKQTVHIQEGRHVKFEINVSKQCVVCKHIKGQPQSFVKGYSNNYL